MAKDKLLRLFVEFNAYETAALEKWQKDLAASGLGELSMGELIRGCVRLYIHEIMGQDYMLGPDIRSILGAKPLT